MPSRGNIDRDRGGGDPRGTSASIVIFLRGGRAKAKTRPARKAAAAKAGQKAYTGWSEAVNQVLAVAEFTLDGTVITANDNFLKIPGYTLDEIKGQHHRMFFDPAYVNSPEYGAFWAKLNRGERDSGAYRRLGKGGIQHWLQASYCPFMDRKRKPSKVVKFTMHVTKHEQRFARIPDSLERQRCRLG